MAKLPTIGALALAAAVGKVFARLQETAGGKVDGDFAMLETELQPVLKALRAGGVDVVAIHNHMTGESPRMMFLHYWGVGPADALAKTIAAALAKTRHD